LRQSRGHGRRRVGGGRGAGRVEGGPSFRRGRVVQRDPQPQEGVARGEREHDEGGVGGRARGGILGLSPVRSLALVRAGERRGTRVCRRAYTGKRRSPRPRGDFFGERQVEACVVEKGFKFGNEALLLGYCCGRRCGRARYVCVLCYIRRAPSARHPNSEAHSLVVSRASPADDDS